MDTPEKKHPCPDCHQCQWCSDDRCRLCLRAASGCRKKLSVTEQIELYEQLNGRGPTACLRTSERKS
ncbi:MAG: hypothetical protein ACYC9I_01005 [Desulfuromonadales bacterium]